MRLILTAVTVLAMVVNADAVEFKFAPADGLECEVTVTSSTIQDAGELAPVKKQSNVGVSHRKYRKTDGGYQITETTKSVEMTRDGKRISSPMVDAALGSVVVWNIGADGAVASLDGYDQLVKKMLSSAPVESRSVLEKSVTADALRNRDIAEWNGRIAEFVGLEVNEGDLVEGKSEFAIPGGAIEYHSLTRFSKIEVRDGRPIVTINFSYDADGDAVKTMMDRIVKDVASIGDHPPAGLDKVKLTKPTISGGGERIIDASTMVIEREKITRVISMPVTVSEGVSATVIRKETKEYTYNCKQ